MAKRTKLPDEMGYISTQVRMIEKLKALKKAHGFQDWEDFFEFLIQNCL